MAKVPGARVWLAELYIREREKGLLEEYCCVTKEFRSRNGRYGMKTRIQELRKERRITQNELADAVDVTRQTIISLENGKYNASLVLAHKLAQFFGVMIEDLFIFDLEEENL